MQTIPDAYRAHHKQMGVLLWAGFGIAMATGGVMFAFLLASCANLGGIAACL